MLGKTEAFSGFSTNDIEASKAFYGETLGLEVTDDPSGLGLKLATGGAVFIYPKDDAHEPATFTVLNFPVDDIDATIDGLTKRGVEFERYDGFDQDERGVMRPPAGEGPLIAWFKDPAGNVLAVLADN